MFSYFHWLRFTGKETSVENRLIFFLERVIDDLSTLLVYIKYIKYWCTGNFYIKTVDAKKDDVYYIKLTFVLSTYKILIQIDSN